MTVFRSTLLYRWEINHRILNYFVWNMIYWKSRKQKCVTKASTYAEYVALSEAVSELNYILSLRGL